jgi:hypothetical protein
LFAPEKYAKDSQRHDDEAAQRIDRLSRMEAVIPRFARINSQNPG